jgi:hypothetical protein
MSTTGNPVPIVYAIRKDPQDEASLFAMLLDDNHLGVCLFTQPEFAREFTRSYPTMPCGTVLAHIELPELRRVLTEQERLGRTYVVTDALLGSPSDLKQRTLRISDYLLMLG